MTRHCLIALGGIVLPLGAAVSQIAAPPLAAVPVSLSSFDFTPSVIHLRAGMPVRMRFTNASSKTHDFSAPEFFAAASQVSPPVTKGRITLSGRGSAAITLVPARGSYRVWCSRFGHEMMGMTATIVVE